MAHDKLDAADDEAIINRYNQLVNRLGDAQLQMDCLEAELIVQTVKLNAMFVELKRRNINV